MKITLYRDPSAFDQLAAEWDDLLSRTSDNLVFLRNSYQQTWWTHLGQGDLLIMTVRDEAERLVGLAPLLAHTNEAGQTQLTLVGCVDVSDYLDVLVDQTVSEAVYTALLDYLAETDEIVWETLFLCSLPHTSATLAQVPRLAEQRGWSVSQEEQDVCPVITLADDWDTYLAGINKKQRHEIRRKIRRLEAETEVKWYNLDAGTGLDEATLVEAMADFVALHQKSARDKEAFWDDKLSQFFYALALKMLQEKILKLFFLDLNGVKAATMLCFDYDNQFLLYNSGYDPAQFAPLSPGNVLISYTIQEAIRLGRTRYNFLRGAEVYKFRFGAEAEAVYDLRIVKSNKHH